MSYYKNSIRNTAIGKRGICLDLERSTLCRVWAIAEGKGLGHGLRPWNVVWVGFASRVVNSYAKEWEDHFNHWGTTYSSVFLTAPWSSPVTSGCVT